MTKTSVSVNLRGVTGLCLAVVASCAMAQQVPTPGSALDSVRQQRPGLDATPPAQPPVSPAPAPAAGVPAGGSKIRITRFEISGNQIFPTAELAEQIAQFQGQELTLFEIFEVSDVITQYYRDRGYSVASCTVPAQQVSSGVVQLEVIEGRVGNVTIEGNQRYREGFLANNIDLITPGDVITDLALRRQLAPLNELPGLNARSVIQPGSQFGESNVVIRASEKPFAAAVRANNYGRTSLGEWRVEADLIANALLGIGERIELNVVEAEGDHLSYVSGRYSMPVFGNFFTRIGGYYSYYDYSVDGGELPQGLQDLGITGEGENYGGNIAHHMLIDDNSLLLTVGFDRTITRQQVDLFSSFERNVINLLIISGNYTMLHSRTAYSSVGLEFSTNFDSNDRDPATLRPEDNAQTGKFRLDIGHFRQLSQYWALLVRASGVASLDPLVDTQRFRIGGQGSVRSYASSELAGDSGYQLTLEVQRRLNLIEDIPMRFLLFADHGRVYRQDSTLIGEEKSESLSGVGAGLDVFFQQWGTLRLEITTPIGAFDPADGRDDVRGWAGLTVNF